MKDKKHKKKKKNKRSSDGKRHKKHHYSSAMFAGMPSTNVDEIAAQFDYLQNSFPGRVPGMPDVLALTSQKNSGSKIYPGFYDHMHKPRKDQVMSFGGQMGQQQLPHTCFGGSQGHS